MRPLSVMNHRSPLPSGWVFARLALTLVIAAVLGDRGHEDWVSWPLILMSAFTSGLVLLVILTAERRRAERDSYADGRPVPRRRATDHKFAEAAPREHEADTRTRAWIDGRSAAFLVEDGGSIPLALSSENEARRPPTHPPEPSQHAVGRVGFGLERPVEARYRPASPLPRERPSRRISRSPRSRNLQRCRTAPPSSSMQR